MNLKKEILTTLALNVCDYLKLDDDLFFCGGHACWRIAEGRKYFCYLAVQDFKIPHVFVRDFLGIADTHTVYNHNKNMRTTLGKTYATQTIIDIEGIRKLCKGLLKAA